MERKLRIGLVGLGFISKVHLEGYAKCKAVSIVAFCDIIEQRAIDACRAFGTEDARVYVDYNEMFERENLDAVSVCTENNMHEPICVAALDAGIHVMCEKPMAITTAEADHMVDAAKRNKRKLTVGYQNRFLKNAAILREMVLNHELGKIYYAEAKAMRRRGVPTWGVFTDLSKQGGGPLIDIGTHLIDLTLWLMNDYSPVVSAVGRIYDHLIPLGGYNSGGPWEIENNQVEDGAFGMVTFASGASLLVNATWAINMKEMNRDGALLYGTHGGAELMQGQLTLNGEHHNCLWQETPADKIVQTESTHDLEIASWVDCLLYNKDPVVKAEEAAHVVRVIEAIYQSARSV